MITKYLILSLGFITGTALVAQEPAALPTKANPPEWIKKGALVYRVSTPDSADFLPQAEEGFKMTSNLLDKTIPQYTIMNGMLGHDHEGAWNWDGLWPYWDRVSFRAGNSWKTLSDFMIWCRDNANTKIGFHVNCTDVNTGLRDYPESREFLQKLIDTKSIYRRDPDANGQRVNLPPYVPTEILKEMEGPDWDGKPRGAHGIVALVNYKNFYDSGLAKSMIDSLYSHLPYAPPIMYLDVLTAAGGNFGTGYPDGPLGGSEQTQIEGMQNIVDYLHTKGSDVSTEGPRPILGVDSKGMQRAGYVWLHGDFSNEDYSVISGNPNVMDRQQVYGNLGCFNLSPIAMDKDQIAKDKAHYAALLDGKPGVKPVAGLDTFHIKYLTSGHDEYDIEGTGDPYRGDWVDLVNNFYLAGIQELYHIGNGAVRTRFERNGYIHIGTYTLKNPGGDITVLFADFLNDWTKEGAIKMRETGLGAEIETKVTVPKEGDYPMSMTYRGMKTVNNIVQLYVNGAKAVVLKDLPTEGEGDGGWSTADFGVIHLKQGENTIALDGGPSRATWTDGTVAEWSTPYLKKGFKVTNGDITLAEDYDRMWPDTWSGQKKIYFFSWDGTGRTWKLPTEWRDQKNVTLYPLTPDGRGKAQKLTIADGSISPKLLPQVPYILTE